MILVCLLRLCMLLLVYEDDHDSLSIRIYIHMFKIYILGYIELSII